MPELPEVENRLLYLRRTALGERIKRVIVTAPGMIKTSGARSFALNLAERSFVDAYRRGKYLIVALDNARSLILHFGMGGDLVFYNSAEDKPEYTRIEFIFESGARLAFTCARKICRVMLVDSVEQVHALRDMGPEPGGKEFSLAYLERVIEESPARQIKPLLMDQKKIAGVGNIYADEILFEAKVRPDRRARDLTEEEIKRIHRETRRVLRKAIQTGGDENFPSYFLVSRSARGANCKACNSEIERKTIGGRTAYFCPQCQN
ncbi:MAG TPA: DNA-formamidopyrimidine glycosylase [Blastocatellia bacterium]|nr:DNA-formamidopyrimidine glycosylase [Blastocatellia bacterium]